MVRVKGSVRYLGAFLRGVERAFDPTLSVRCYRRYDRTRDAEALASDWRAIGGDLRRAMARFERTARE